MQIPNTLAPSTRSQGLARTAKDSRHFVIADYYQNQAVQKLCNDSKAGDRLAIFEIAKHMSSYSAILPLDGILIPMASHAGQATTALVLVEQLSKLCGLPFADLLTGHPHEPLHTLKQRSKTPILVAVIFDAGQMEKAAARLFPDQSPIVFAYAQVKQVIRPAAFAVRQ